MVRPRIVRKWSDLSRAEQLSFASPEERAQFFNSLSKEQLEDLTYDWTFWGRPKQLPPPGDWGTWMLRAGRGFGKTRSGMGGTQQRAMEERRWIALVARTPADARDYMIEGPGGFLDAVRHNVKPSDRPAFEPSKRRLTWPNGSWATIFSDEEPDQLRGFSGDTAWLDEFGKFRNPERCWDMLRFGMRECSKDKPRIIITTTPRPLPVIRMIEAMPSTVTVTGSSYENESNLDPAWFTDVVLQYEGTTLGRQEIYADLLDPEDSGIIKRSWFKLWPANKPLPRFEQVIISLDTAFTERTMDKDSREPDPTACGVYGLFTQDKYRVPGDRSTSRQKYQVMVLDCWDEFLGFPDLIERVRKEMKVAYGEVDAPVVRPLYGSPLVRGQGRRPDLLLIEDKGSGISLRQQMERESVPAYAYNPGRLDKLQRLHLISHVVKAGLVWLVESETQHKKPKTWTEPLLEQLCSFAGEGSIKHDDHVDQFTQAIRVMLDKHLVAVFEEPERDPYAADDRPWARPLIKPAVNPYAA